MKICWNSNCPFKVGQFHYLNCILIKLVFQGGWIVELLMSFQSIKDDSQVTWIFYNEPDLLPERKTSSLLHWTENTHVFCSWEEHSFHLLRLSVLQTTLKRWYRTKAVNSLVCKTPKHLRDRVENCLSLPITNASPELSLQFGVKTSEFKTG